MTTRKSRTETTYILILFLPRARRIEVGALGRLAFKPGLYFYVGSGGSSPAKRIARHVRRGKKRFWHIDYLLENENVSVEAVIAAETNENMECDLNQSMKKILEAKIPVKGFGASDCQKNCGSHLLYFPEIRKADFLVQRLVRYLHSSVGILSVCVVH